MKSIFLATFIAFAGAAQAQTATGVPVQGVVLQRGSDELIWGATVELRKGTSSAAIYGARTGSDGKFAFPSVAPGSYRLIANAPGYVSTEYGQKRMNGAGLPFEVAAGQQVSNLRMEMVPTAAISGRVTDPAGQPIAIADVFVLRSSYQEGQRILTPYVSGKTDERGEYRIFWLMPGTYYLNVVVPDGTNQADLIINGDAVNSGNSIMGVRNILRDVLSRPIGTGATENEAHVPIYYPSTSNPQQARAIEVRAGEDIRNINFTVGVVRTYHVRGTAVSATGMPTLANGRLIPLDPAWPPSPVSISDATGKFDVARVVPGPYMLYVQMRPAGATTPADAMWAAVPLEVREQDIDNLSIVTRTGISLPGKIVIDGQPVKDGVSPAAGLFLGMRPDPLVTQQAPSPSTRVSTDGTFTFPGVIAGNYRIYVPPLLSPNNNGLLGGLPPIPPHLENSYVKSIRVGGTEVLDGGIRLTPAEGLTMEIVLGTNAAVVEGRVMRDGQPAAEITVGTVPSNLSARGFRMDMHKATLTDSAGRFQLRGLPPGDYKIFAWEEADKLAIMDLDFIKSYEEKGTRLEIADGENKSIDLTVIPPRTP